MRENPFDLSGKVAAITGPTRGIGRSIALGLAESGADIALIQRHNQDDVKKEVEDLGVKCEIILCDLSKREDLHACIPRIISEFGAIDILVNNGGIQRRSPAVEFSEQDWDDVISVNLNAVWFLAQAAGREMVKKESGKIINIASLISFQGGINIPAYASAKGGVAQLTKALSNEWAKHNVNVNAIAPGYIATDMNEALINDKERSVQILDRIPAGRWGSPDDFKGSAIYLASDAASYVHGHVLTVDGGWMGR
ncbi:SDR family oxidoreductase [Gracilibacillus sp. YIM 98692]|uniref:SDR family oxidoreductase n=1 Tax=Gracilibacillus sp. YIM 98692 TaxID=2663532 RepID=UPI001F092327|nr:SDR family oxidoreductase [Gracilibacillus sp. YIM 98692]